MSTSPFVIEVNDASFEQEVLERSKTVPVVVDFWAEWCAPCRMLGPQLEQLAEEHGGRFVLAKADTEQTPQAATQFGVQSIPAVYGLRDGKVIDAFVGVLPEPELKAWLEKILPSVAEELVQQARHLIDSDPAAAEAKFREALEADPRSAEAEIGLAELLTSTGRSDEAAALIEQLEERGFLEPEAEKVKATLELRDKAAEAGDVDDCRAAVKANPDDGEARLNLAKALAGQEEYEEALQIGLDLVERDRARFGDSARELMVEIFRQLPDDSELTHTYRRKLSTALY